ncbi:MAG TPA: outer membrane protein assembly factor BamD [Terriglobales bacterium]|nr:outer membrane protein assembly factor BamD [Terriglobales bacterium]
MLPVLLLAIGLTGCHKTKAQNPIANVDSKQPDKVLYDRAMQTMAQKKYDVARMTLQTLINTYPDSEFVARAKLAIGDSWYDEGGTAGFAQAEIEYKDFITFFPNMPEAAEAQLKVANIHYRQMEKPDRDYTHAKRAEEEYKQLLLQFPDSKLVPEAKQRLLEVQEVLAEREFRIGRFYYLRQNFAASIARLKSLTETYPLYSGAEDALYTLGQIYEDRANYARSNAQLPEALKGAIIQDFDKKAEDAYAHIITRYPVTARAEDAKKRLEALHVPVPTPTAAAIAQNKAEEESRQQLGKFGRLMLNLHRQPDVSMATKVGEPTLVEPKQVSATEVNREMNSMVQSEAKKTATGGPSGGVAVSTGSTATPGPNEPAPRSDASTVSQPPPPAPPQLNQAAPPPAQVNDAATSTDSTSTSTTKTDSSKDSQDANKNESSSKKKEKKGLRKLIPF